MKILLLGKNGQVGYELKRSLVPLGELIALGRQELDLTDKVAIRSVIRRIRPGLIVNAAAYTAVDKAESEPELAMAVNGFAPGIMAEEAAMIKATLLHYSTDYVFDGKKQTPYREEDTPNPINTYGKTKLAGEEAIKATETNHLIFRTSWVYGLRGHNFMRTILSLAAEKEELSVVDDQFGAPTWCRTIAEITAAVITSMPLAGSCQSLMNMTAAGKTTWFGFARAIIDQAIATGRLKNKPALIALNTDQYPTSASRPANSRLDCRKLEKEYSLTLPDWKNELIRSLG